MPTISVTLDRNKTVTLKYTKVPPTLMEIKPVSASAPSTVWAGKSDCTGNPNYAIDGNTWTSWTYNGNATIKFDLGKEYEVQSTRYYIIGHVTGVINIKNITVDGKTLPARGRYVSVECEVVPPNTWVEISEFWVAVLA